MTDPSTAEMPAKSPITFQVDFSSGFGGSQSATASVAHGDAKPLPSERSPSFEEDLVAHSGFVGLRVGPGQPAILYRAEENLPTGTGKISLSFRDAGFKAEGAWPLLQVASQQGFPQLELMANPDKTLTLSAQSQTGKSVSFTAKWEASTQDLQLVYEPKRIALFSGDSLLGEADWEGAPSWSGAALKIGTDLPGSASYAVLSGIAVSSDPSITSQSSNSAQPAQLEANQLPSLKEGQHFNGSPSPWWEQGMPRLGLEALNPDTVPAPFTPILWKQDVAHVWGRQYALGQNHLVSQITSSGQDILKTPLRVLISQQSKEKVIQFSPPRLVEHQDGLLVLERTAEDPLLNARAKIFMEYDGLVWIEMAFKTREAAPVDTLVLEIDLNPQVAKFFQYVGAPHKYESQNLFRNSYAGAVPKSGEPPMELGFKTHVWLGSDEVGLQWFSESDENWWPLDRPNCIQIVNDQEKGLLLRLNIQSEALPPSHNANFTIKFGLMASPVKPMPSGWRGWTFTSQYGSLGTGERANHLIYWPDKWRSMPLDPEPHRAIPEKVAEQRRQIEEDHRAGRKILPYWTRIHVPVSAEELVNPDGERMAELWGTEPDIKRPPKLDLRRVSMDSAWSDYLVWCFDQWGDIFGRIDGIYLDETQPIPNTRQASGGGYTAADGSRRPTFEFRGSRNYIKRLNYLARQRNGEPAFSVIHNSSTYTLPSMSEFTVFLPGEHMNSGYFRDDNPESLPPEEERALGYYYTHVLPMERLRAEGYWQPWGFPIVWLPQLKNQKDIMDSPVAARDLLSRIQQVDALIWPLFINREEIARMIAFRKDFGIADPEVEFIPYWRNGEISTAQTDVLVGYYQKPGSRLVIISNLNREPVEVDLLFKNPPELVRLADTKTLVPLAKKQVRLEIPRNDYIALLTKDPIHGVPSSTTLP